MLSWNPGKHRTVAKLPIALKVAVWNLWEKKQSKPLHFGPWIQLGIRQRRKCWLGSSGKSVHSLPSGIFGKCCSIRFLACPESSLPHASLPIHSSGLKPTKLLIVFAPAIHELVGTWVPLICRLSSLPSLWDWVGVAECGGSQSSVDITVTWKAGKDRLLGPTPYSFWFSRSAVRGPQIFISRKSEGMLILLSPDTMLWEPQR